MAKAYEDNLVNPEKKYMGSDKDMVKHLTDLWKAKKSTFGRDIEFDNLPQKIDLIRFKDTLSRISDNLVFRGNFGVDQK